MGPRDVAMFGVHATIGQSSGRQDFNPATPGPPDQWSPLQVSVEFKTGLSGTCADGLTHVHGHLDNKEHSSPRRDSHRLARVVIHAVEAMREAKVVGYESRSLTFNSKDYPPLGATLTTRSHTWHLRCATPPQLENGQLTTAARLTCGRSDRLPVSEKFVVLVVATIPTYRVAQARKTDLTGERNRVLFGRPERICRDRFLHAKPVLPRR